MASNDGSQPAADHRATVVSQRSPTRQSGVDPQTSLAHQLSREASFGMPSAAAPENPVRQATLTSMPSGISRSASLRYAPSSISVAAMNLLEEMANDERVALANESGDYRVKLTGPDGEISVNIWDLSLYPLWPFDHYQSLRREYLEMRGKPDRTPEEILTTRFVRALSSPMQEASAVHGSEVVDNPDQMQ
ncbi:conserved hypothetical protein [Neospora caninum Liverpool]|uniref:Uncharacterized protein n=1 Tax=Neospora caninum (strain Liverpool) TaxID=572307 RepID=F0VNX3_NEOCL|nr:conserved hypothetical protein [Neospora caninum Liverpool]CBZ55419.1 conserved hypothetical protein [Neospora caninum Liverpool]|eukprot:XP_003885447.1 conserved hypothetical protein [Neospora caninum Liverpool]